MYYILHTHIFYIVLICDIMNVNVTVILEMKLSSLKISSGHVCDSLSYQTGKCTYRSRVGFSVYSATDEADNL